MRFVKESIIPVSAEELWALHERPDALALLTPPWQKTRIIEAPRSLTVGTRVRLETKIGPFWQEIVAEHTAHERGRMFEDTMRKGPFSKWVHRHVITPRGPSESLLTDEVDYELPFGFIGRLVGARAVRRELERLFAHRHHVTRRACLEGVTSPPDSGSGSMTKHRSS